MKNDYFKTLLAGAMLCATASAMAEVEYPAYPTQTLTDGQTYVLCNLANPTGYTCRTNWDNAIYFLGKNDFAGEYGVRVTAHYDAGQELWYFTTTETFHEAVEADPDNGIEAEEAYTSYTYMGVPGGTDNVNARYADLAYWQVTPGKTAGFYQLTAADGNANPNVIGVQMHLNSGGQYFVLSEPTNQWYPDFYGGTAKEEDGADMVVYDEATDTYYKVMADETSKNWAFVLEEDLPTYIFMGTAWNELNSFEKNYCVIEDFEAGFKASLAAAVELSKKEGFGQDDYDAMKAILDAKINLYNQLQKAYGVDAAQLTAVIEAAEAAFATKTSAEEVGAAYEALKKACDDYAMGLGDITAMGQNMSFEDLSSQNGNQTSGVAAPPAGWNVFINGQQVTSASEISPYVQNWHGINNDCDGYKDGDYGFGIWTSNVPEYEISQTITGLDNGTYTITCGLMVGANGNGSRRTVQRLFGNYSSTLFAGEGEYEEGILPMEYKDYAYLSEPQTDRNMQEISVKAYVFDGTLTFGIRTNGDVQAALRSSKNSAGGDGWFKCDNFTISKDGFDEADRDEIYNYFKESLDNVLANPMDATYRGKYESVPTDHDAAIPVLAGYIAEAAAQAKAYEPLVTAIEEAYDKAAKCEENNYAGSDDFFSFIDEVKGNYEDGKYTADEIQAVIESLDEAYQTCLHSGISEGADVSDLIANRSFEDWTKTQGGDTSGSVENAPAGWTLKINDVECVTAADIRAQGVTAWCAINQGDGINVEEDGVVYNHQYTDGNHLWGIWNASIPQVELSQTLTGLKPGTYTLTCDVMARSTDWTGPGLTTQRIFANNVICLYGQEGDYMPEYLEGTTSDDVYQAYSLTYNEGAMLDEENEYPFLCYAGWDSYTNDILLRTLTLHFGVGEDGIATIGFRTDNLDPTTGETHTSQAAGWFKLDNWTLYYESSKIPEGIATGIANIHGGECGTIKADGSRYATYDLSGRRVSKAVKGIYIQNGTKVVK